jgi:hypothetical protein
MMHSTEITSHATREARLRRMARRLPLFCALMRVEAELLLQDANALDGAHDEKRPTISAEPTPSSHWRCESWTPAPTETNGCGNGRPTSPSMTRFAEREPRSTLARDPCCTQPCVTW